MHVPDGFLDLPTSVATGAVAVAGVGLALRGARRELDDRTAPLAGLVATFVFAAQMLNFPVGAGTSGHLLGGALAAVLVGPWTGVLCLAVVLLVQSLLFADGGITRARHQHHADGSGRHRRRLVRLPRTPVGAAQTHRPGRTDRRRRRVRLGGVTALAFVGLYAVGGQAPVSLTALATAMLSWHALIGLGEAAITGLVVGSVVGVRPDLVYGARRVLAARELSIRDSSAVGPRRDPESAQTNPEAGAA